MPARLNNAEIQRRGNRFARALDSAGVPYRGVVACLLPNVAEFIYCLRGATWSGRTFTPINWHLAPGDINYIVENCEADALVVHAKFGEVARGAGVDVPPNARFCVAGAIDGFRDFAEVDAFSDLELESPSAGTVMLYTSGTTGRPKGVMTSAVGLDEPPCLSSRMGSAMLATYLQDDAAGTHLVVAPLYHAAPSTYAEGAAHLGAEVVIMEHWNAEAFLRTVEAEKVTSTFLVPTHFVRLLQLPEATRRKYDTRSLKLVCHGAAPVAPDVKRRMIEWLGPVLFEFYGGTEGGGVSIDSQTWLAHPGSVGRPRPGLEIHILDPQGKPLPPGESGDVYFYSAENRFEYKGDPAKTAAAYRDDLYTLGDIGYLDDEGFLYLRDRRADTIIRGGVNIYPAQIEAILIAEAGVADCCVVGVPDDEWGEHVLAVIEPTQSVSDLLELETRLRECCKEALGRYQRPHRYAFSDQLPRTETGKLLRRQVRDHYRKANDTAP